jgi:UDP-2-acetamido-3-amino-2,3-dideoxy-glucuronate N-acetyltransferase
MKGIPRMKNRSFFQHSTAIIESGARIGSQTRIWAFAHILGEARIGRNCNICDHVFIENDVQIGNRVTIKCGVYVWDGVRVADDVFISPSVVFTNDRRPRSKRYPAKFLTTHLLKGCSIGANATILPGLTIGRWAMIGAGSVVTRDVPDFGQVAGNPARLVAWVCHCGLKLSKSTKTGLECECGAEYLLNAANTPREVTDSALEIYRRKNNEYGNRQHDHPRLQRQLN